MSDNWPSPELVAAELRAQAEATAYALGHRLVEGIQRGGVWMTRCRWCRLDVVVEPRAYRRPRIRGGAVALGCR